MGIMFNSSVVSKKTVVKWILNLVSERRVMILDMVDP